VSSKSIVYLSVLSIQFSLFLFVSMHLDCTVGLKLVMILAVVQYQVQVKGEYYVHSVGCRDQVYMKRKSKEHES